MKKFEEILTFIEENFSHSKDKKIELWEHQKKSIETNDRFKAIQAGRKVGKTTEIEIMSLYWSLNRLPVKDAKEGLVAYQREQLLEPTFYRIIQRIESNPGLKEKVKRIHKSPPRFIHFKNDFILWFKISGYRGINFNNTHVDFIIVDEAQEMLDDAWDRLRQALNKNGYLWVYGVPNGLRNKFYEITTNADSGFTIFHWPSNINPDFDDEMEKELIKFYGGIKSQGYIHNCLGLHGSPAYSVFDMEQYTKICKKENYISTQFNDDNINQWERILNLSFKNFKMDINKKFYIGCDLGYSSDPTEIVGWELSNTDNNEKLASRFRIHLERVSYPVQAKIIKWLVENLNIIAAGIDTGGSGIAVYQDLSTYENLKYKIKGFSFGSKYYFDNYNPDSKISQSLKHFATDLLVKFILEEKLIMNDKDKERESQYANHTYHLNNNGEVIYNKGKDHIIDADRVMILAYYEINKIKTDRIIIPPVVKYINIWKK